MKKIGLIGMCLLLSAATLFAKDKETKDASVLPANSKEFLNRHFQGIQISHIKVEEGLLKTDSYDVILTNGVNVEFSGSGSWKEVEGKNIAVPSGIVPANICKYVQTNYPGKTILSIEKNRRGYDIKLDNDIEIDFDRSGNYQKTDF